MNIELTSKRQVINPTNGETVPYASIIGSGTLVGVDEGYFYISHVGDNESISGEIIPYVHRYSRDRYNIRIVK